MIKPMTISQTRTFKHFELDGEKLIFLLHRAGLTEIPKNARVRVPIPGGGDCSNMDLEDEDLKIFIEWSEGHTERTEGSD